MLRSLPMLVVGVSCLAACTYFCIFVYTSVKPTALVLHLPSLMIVAGGVLGLAFILSEPKDVLRFCRFLFSSSTGHGQHLKKTEGRLESMLDIYVEQGPAELRSYVYREKLPKVWRAIAVNLEAGIPVSDVRHILDFQLRQVFGKIDCDLGVLRKLTALAPSVGMLGTVLGLIRLLANMKDFDSLGTDMSLALITTLYGIVLGNFLFVPLVNKLEKKRQLYLKSHRLAQHWLAVLEHNKPSHYLKPRVMELTGATT